jgi:hypothetical protein
MSDKIELKDIKLLVEECIKNDKTEFLSNLIFVLQNNYKDLALLCTDGNYHDGWSHTKVLDYVTYELN